MKMAPFFIIGSKRGGTTLLRLMLNKNSNIIVPPESHFFIPLLKKFTPKQLLSKEELVIAGNIIKYHPRFVTWNITENRFEELLGSLQTPGSLSDLISVLFEEKTKEGGKERWGEKTPEYIDIIPEISALFPNAFFIALLRDGRDVNISLKQRGWEGWSIYQRALYWQRCARNMQFLKQSGINALFIKYEELVQNPASTLKQITGFLDTPYEDQMMNFTEDYKKNITTTEIATGVHTKLKRLPELSDIYKWKNSLSNNEIWKFESVCYEELLQSGYEIACFKQSNPLHIIAGKIYRATGIFSIGVYKIYHSIFSMRIKKKMRKNNVYLQLRKAVRNI